MEKEIKGLSCTPSVPAVFIGQELIGGANEKMTLHLKVQLVPLLLRANAIWVWRKLPEMAMVTSLVNERSVVIFSKSSCCMSHTIKTLISSFGANPTVYELDEHPKGHQLDKELRGLGCKPSVPAVFIGQELIGGANEIMSLHLKGQLVPLLLRANAIWV
ncbi:monothiol glutaredoxin-S2-like protein [Tanacetum coccineum]|uniref:Monothiol glutaredoxin-S2-like protein n=1 Tax=Tanacetum coccineum TaxID=301880 RepID=A0ABQ5F333_9ASTR